MISTTEKTFAEILTENFREYGKKRCHTGLIQGVLLDMTADIYINFLFPVKLRPYAALTGGDSTDIFAEYGGKREKIASITTNEGEFPCTLTYFGMNTTARDKEELERALKGILSDKRVAAQVWSLMGP